MIQESLLQDLTNECKALKESCEVRIRNPPFYDEQLCSSNDSHQTKRGAADMNKERCRNFVPPLSSAEGKRLC